MASSTELLAPPDEYQDQDHDQENHVNDTDLATVITETQEELSKCNVIKNFDDIFEIEERRKRLAIYLDILGPEGDEKHQSDRKILAQIDECVESKMDPKIKANAQKLEEDLGKKIQVKRNECADLWAELLKLKDEMDKKDEPLLSFTIAHNDVINSMKALKNQFHIRKQVRMEKIKDLIIHLREQINGIWSQCFLTNEEKSEFVAFHSNEYTEEMMEIHKAELKKWTNYRNKNQEIFEKIQKRKEMWETLRELEIRSEDPNRFVNRGGSLLKDQKEHANLMKNLPKLETEIKSLSQLFEKQHGKTVKILGEEINHILAREWQKFNDEKAARKADRNKSRQLNGPVSTAAARTGEKRAGGRTGATPAAKKEKLQY